MVLLVLSSLLVLAATVGGVRHRRLRRRWVSPYAGFRAAGARVTRTAGGPFHVAGAQRLRP
jgi:hypothetical protein